VAPRNNNDAIFSASAASGHLATANNGMCALACLAASISRDAWRTITAHNCCQPQRSARDGSIHERGSKNM